MLRRQVARTDNLVARTDNLITRASHWQPRRTLCNSYHTRTVRVFSCKNCNSDHSSFYIMLAFSDARRRVRERESRMKLNGLHSSRKGLAVSSAGRGATAQHPQWLYAENAGIICQPYSMHHSLTSNVPNMHFCIRRKRI